MVNILKAMSEIDLENDDFLTTILEAVVDNFNELKITWAITLMRTLGTISLGNQELLLASMTEISQAMHKKLKSCYDSKAEVSIEDIPDFTDYHSLWLSLQLFAAKRTRVSSNPEVRASTLLDESSQAIKMLANDLIKIFYGNKRWKA